MSAITKKIEAGSPMGRRDTLRIAGTGCICAKPEFREVTVDGKPLSFLNLKVISNSIRKNDDGSATQYSEFTDVVLSGNRAKALGKVLAKGQTIEFAGKLRTRSFDSKTFHDTEGKPAQIYRTETIIGQDGWVNIMKDAENGEKADMGAAATPLAPNGIPGFAELAAQMKELMAQVKVVQNAPAESEGTPPAAEVIIDLNTTADGLPVDDDIPF